MIEINEADRARADQLFRTWRNDRVKPADVRALPTQTASKNPGKLQLAGVHPDYLPILELHGISYRRVE
jgi:hypothetical protein